MECKTTVLRRQAHPEHPNRFSEPPKVNLARLHCPPHLPNTRINLRSGGQASHNLTSSRTILSQTSRPKRRDHRVNRNSPSSRRRCSKLRTDRNHLHVKPPPRSNLRPSRLRSWAKPRIRDNHRSFSSNRFSHSPSHRSSLNSHFDHNINNHLHHSNNNRPRERTRSRIWPGYSNLLLLMLCLAFLGSTRRRSVHPFGFHPFFHPLVADLLCVFI